MSNTLEGQKVRQTYGDVLQVPNGNAGIDSTLRRVRDGKGDGSALRLSTTQAEVDGALNVTGALTAATLTLGTPYPGSGVSAAPSLTGQVQRTGQSKFDDSLNVKDFGAKGDGATDDSAAIMAMHAACDYVRFEPGNYRVAVTISLVKGMSFAAGACVTIDTGIELRFWGGYIDSPRQWIFQGAGKFKLIRMTNTAGGMGDPLYPEWWGVLGQSGNMANPGLNAMADSVSELTECHFLFAAGLYRVAQTVTFPRGTYLEGAGGTARTVFQPTFAAGDVFVCSDVKFRVEGIQFENRSGLGITPTSGACVRCDFGLSSVRDVGGQGFILIKLGGNENIIENCGGSPPNLAGTAVVEVTGSENKISGITGTTANADGAVVRVSGSGSGRQSISHVVNFGSLGYAVDIRPTGIGLNYNINDVSSRGCDALVRIYAVSGATIGYFNITNVTCGRASGKNGVLIHSDGGTIYRGSIRGVQMPDLINVGIELRRTSGNMSKIGISDCYLEDCTTGILQTGGSIIDVRIADSVYYTP